MGPYMQQDLTAVEARVRRITHGACLVCVPWGLPSTRTYAKFTFEFCGALYYAVRTQRDLPQQRLQYPSFTAFHPRRRP